MGLLLEPKDDYPRKPGPESNWNESRYVDFYDPVKPGALPSTTTR